MNSLRMPTNMHHSKLRGGIRKAGGQVLRNKNECKRHFMWICCGTNILGNKANEKDDERWKDRLTHIPQVY